MMAMPGVAHQQLGFLLACASLLLPSALAVPTVGVLWERTDDNDSLTRAVELACAGGSTVLVWREAADASVEVAMERMLAAAGDDLVGFIGPRSSDEARFAARDSPRPIVSPTATAEFLGDRDEFPTFRRLVPSDLAQSVAFAAFLNDLGFGRVAVLFDRDSDWASAMALSLVTPTNDRDILVQPFPMTRENMTTAELKRMDTFRARLCLGSSGFCEDAFRTAAAAPQPLFGAPNYVWFVPEAPAQLATQAWMSGLLGVRLSTEATPLWYDLASALGDAPTWKEASAFDSATALSRSAAACSSAAENEVLSCMLTHLD
eukprot:COSAG04_NODE_7581_length_1103_cov_3.698207_1_plen_317_part_01